MISRIWHGWTTPENANAYEKLLRHEIIEGFIDRKIDGFRRMHILRRILGEEVEFTTIMWFDSIDSIRVFAGENYEASVVPPEARALRARGKHFYGNIPLKLTQRTQGVN
ncbi:MAG: antibiotic biosynthesis monooxygenase [Desulfobacterales bacterium]|nr:antibiotic biosynthesis monooxygenase [Desulfobacterales bacterium]